MAHGLDRGEAKRADVYTLCSCYRYGSNFGYVSGPTKCLTKMSGAPGFKKVGQHGTAKSLNSIIWPAGAAGNRRKNERKIKEEKMNIKDWFFCSLVQFVCNKFATKQKPKMALMVKPTSGLPNSQWLHPSSYTVNEQPGRKQAVFEIRLFFWKETKELFCKHILTIH